MLSGLRDGLSMKENNSKSKILILWEIWNYQFFVIQIIWKKNKILNFCHFWVPYMVPLNKDAAKNRKLPKFTGKNKMKFESPFAWKQIFGQYVAGNYVLSKILPKFFSYRKRTKVEDFIKEKRMSLIEMSNPPFWKAQIFCFLFLLNYTK